MWVVGYTHFAEDTCRTLLSVTRILAADQASGVRVRPVVVEIAVGDGKLSQIQFPKIGQVGQI